MIIHDSTLHKLLSVETDADIALTSRVVNTILSLLHGMSNESVFETLDFIIEKNGDLHSISWKSGMNINRLAEDIVNSLGECKYLKIRI